MTDISTMRISIRTNDMDARFSAVDDRDERANRIYMVVGHLENYFPDLTVRICKEAHTGSSPLIRSLSRFRLKNFRTSGWSAFR